MKVIPPLLGRQSPVSRCTALAGGFSLLLDLWHQEDLCRAEVVSLVRSRTPCQGVRAAAFRCMLLLSANRQVQPVVGSSRQLAATRKCRQYVPALGAAPTRHLYVGSRSIMAGSFCQFALRSAESADVVQHCSGQLSVMRHKACGTWREGATTIFTRRLESLKRVLLGAVWFPKKLDVSLDAFWSSRWVCLHVRRQVSPWAARWKLRAAAPLYVDAAGRLFQRSSGSGIFTHCTLAAPVCVCVEALSADRVCWYWWLCSVGVLGAQTETIAICVR